MSIAQRHRREHETVAIVTGATGGIGVTTTEALMSAGVHVILAVRDQARGEALLARLLSAGPGRKGTVLPLNVADLKSVNGFVDKFQALGCPLHLLVNNAGIMALPNFKASPDGVEMQFATNHLGHFHLTGLLLPLLEQSGSSQQSKPLILHHCLQDTMYSLARRAVPVVTRRMQPMQPMGSRGIYGLAGAENPFVTCGLSLAAGGTIFTVVLWNACSIMDGKLSTDELRKPAPPGQSIYFDKDGNRK